MNEYTVKRRIMGHIERGTELYQSITRIVQANNVTVGRVTGLGAVQRAKLAYYDQKEMKYRDLIIGQPMEIVSLYGNISLRDGKPFAHVHVVLADHQGQCQGGHLLPEGTPVFACELVIEEFAGPLLVRNPDASTGLALWPKEAIL